MHVVYNKRGIMHSMKIYPNMKRFPQISIFFFSGQTNEQCQETWTKEHNKNMILWKSSGRTMYVHYFSFLVLSFNQLDILCIGKGVIKMVNLQYDLKILIDSVLIIIIVVGNSPQVKYVEIALTKIGYLFEH